MLSSRISQHTMTSLAATSLAALAGVGGLAACASSSSGGTTTPATASAVGTNPCAKDALAVRTPGKLTIATDKPAYTPWFVDDNPSNGKGFESAVAYAVANKLGFTPAEVAWTVASFNSVIAPGPKNFDFDINEVSVTAERATAVTFSDGYFDDNQALVVNKGTPIASATSIADLQQYKLGVQIGTTSFSFVQDVIKPTTQPNVYDNSTDVIQALNNGQIDGYVVDAPTAYVNVLIGQAKKGVVLGQFANTGEHFGLVFSLGNPLVSCVNQAIASLKDDGTLDSLRSQWLADLNYPVLS